MEQHATCTPAHNVCDTFAYITCRVKAHTFYELMEHERALDVCYELETVVVSLRGRFLQGQGIQRVTRVFSDRIGRIGNHAVCNPAWHGCSTFEYINVD